MAPVQHYSVFGRSLASSLRLPHLGDVVAGEACWHLEEVPRIAVAPGTTPLSSLRVDNCRFELARTPGGFRFAHSCSGIYEVSPRTGRISWARRAGAPVEQAEGDLVGRLLPLLLHEEGMFCLHGSAIGTEQGIIAFLADSGSGKSTLAQALVTQGASLVGDDAVVVDVANDMRVQPGITTLRLCADSAATLLEAPERLERSTDGKHVVRAPVPPAGQAMFLRAVYVLKPAAANAPVPDVERMRLSSTDGTLALLAHDKLLGLLGPAEGARLLARAARVAQAIPVYELSVARRLERVRDVADTILSWHSSAPVAVHAGD